MALEELVLHIENKHHKYVENKSSEIQHKIDKICTVHGAQHPELFEVKELFQECVGELAKHMKKEELILFPYILKMTRAMKGELTYSKPLFSPITNPINQMEDDHKQEGERFELINKSTDNLNAPSDAYSTYTATFKMLKEFEDDLHLHIHLENNILFPKSIDLENSLKCDG